jgi:uncharacterized protein YndB with AHSA1/START domain
MSGKSRQHELEVEISATAERVWQGVSTAEGIASWFAPIARVTPGVGGTVFLRWGDGVEGASRIEVWEPERHLRLATDRGEGAPPSVVDYFLEGKGGSTVLRLVHSGFGPEASCDDEYESTGSAWPVFLTMMKHSAEHGLDGVCNATVFRILDRSREECWDTLMGPRGLGAGPALAHAAPGGRLAVRDASGESLDAVVRHSGSWLCCLEFPGLRDAMLSVFCENAGGQAMLTLTWLLYGTAPDEAEAIRERWSEFVDRLFTRGAAGGGLE